jgi:hypothetical protein
MEECFLDRVDVDVMLDRYRCSSCSNIISLYRERSATVPQLEGRDIKIQGLEPIFVPKCVQKSKKTVDCRMSIK